MDDPTREELRGIARTMKAIAENQDIGASDDRRDREIKSLASGRRAPVGGRAACRAGGIAQERYGARIACPGRG